MNAEEKFNQTVFGASDVKKVMEPIIVWEYYKAPEELRISENGGDEDWLAEIPPCFANAYIGWLEVGQGFGSCYVDEYDHPTKPGWKIRVGCHA